MATWKHRRDTAYRYQKLTDTSVSTGSEKVTRQQRRPPVHLVPASSETADGLSAVLGAFTDAAAILSQSAEVLVSNPAYDALLRNSGETFTWVGPDGGPVPADQTPLLRAARSETADVELVLIDATQTRHPVQVSVRPLSVHRTPGVAGCVVIRDLCDRQARLLADRFVELLSHELKAPVTSLRSHAELFVRYLDCDLSAAEARFAMQRIHALSSRLGLMIHELYELARITSGKLQIKRTPVNLHDVVTSAVDIAEALPNMPPIHITLAGPAPVISGDAERLSGVVVNLLTNAAMHAFSTDGITIRIWSDGEGAAIDVEDRGPGIPPEEITRIFRRHYQVQQGDNADATNDGNSTSLGLGLYVAQQIVQAHDGRLSVTSELGVGSRFTMYLPRS